MLQNNMKKNISTSIIFCLIIVFTHAQTIKNDRKAIKIEEEAVLDFENKLFNQASQKFIDLGIYYFLRRDYAKSIRNYLYAAESFKKNHVIDSALKYNDLSSEIFNRNSINDSSIYWKIKVKKGELLYEIDSINIALNIFNSILKLSKHKIDSIDIINVLYNLGKINISKTEFKIAEDYLLTAKKDLINNVQQKYLLIQVNNTLASCYLYQGNNNYCEDILKENEVLLNMLKLDNDCEKVKMYNIYGNFYCNIGKYDLALNYLNQANQILNIFYRDEIKELIRNYTLTGLVYKNKGNYHKALDNNFKALNLKKNLFGNSHLSLTTNYNNIGNIYLKINDLEKAYEYLNMTLEIERRRLGSNHPYVAMSMGNIALYYIEKEEYDKALALYEDALNIYKDLYTDEHLQVIISYYNISNTFSYLNLFDSAIYYNNKSRLILEKMFGENHLQSVYLDKGLGLIYKQMGEYNESINNYKKALNTFKEHFNIHHPDIAETYYHIGEIYSLSNNFLKSVEYLDSALISNLIINDYYQKIYEIDSNYYISRFACLDMHHFASALMKLADVYYRQYLINDSIKLLELSNHLYKYAHQTINILRQDFNSENSILYLNSSVKPVLSNSVDIAYELYHKEHLKDIENLHWYIDNVKSTSMYSLLPSSYTTFREGFPFELINYEDSLKTLLRGKKLELLKLHDDTIKESKEETNLLKIEIFDLSRKIDSLISNYYTQQPNSYKFKYTDVIRPVNQIQTKLTEDEVILNYLFSSSNLYIEVISNTIYDIKKITAIGSLADSVHQYLKAIKSFNINKTKQLSLYLYESLILPVCDDIKDKKKLIILPDEYLYYLPFETLIMSLERDEKLKSLKDLNYLIKQFSIVYHYSASLWFTSEKATSDKNEINFIGFAPIFDESEKNGYVLESNVNYNKFTNLDSIFRSLFTIYNDEINALPYTKEELISIIEIFEKANISAVGYFQDKASETNFKNNCNNFKIIHIATHGIVNENHPELSGLLFYQDPNIWNTENY